MPIIDNIFFNIFFIMMTKSKYHYLLIPSLFFPLPFLSNRYAGKKDMRVNTINLPRN